MSGWPRRAGCPGRDLEHAARRLWVQVRHLDGDPAGLGRGRAGLDDAAGGHQPASGRHPEEHRGQGGHQPLHRPAFPYVNGRNDYFGYGRLNVGRAVRWAYPPSLAPVGAEQAFLLTSTAPPQERFVTLRNPSDQSVWWQATILPGASWLSAAPTSGTTSYTEPGALALRVNANALPPGAIRAR